MVIRPNHPYSSDGAINKLRNLFECYMTIQDRNMGLCNVFYIFMRYVSSSGKFSDENIAAVRKLLEETEEEVLAKQGQVDPPTKCMKAYKDIEAETQRIKTERNLIRLKMMAEREERERIREENEREERRRAKEMEARVSTSKEERQTSGQEDKEKMDPEEMNLEDFFSEEEDSRDDTQEENSRVSSNEKERQTSRQVDKEGMVLEGIENSTFEAGKPNECINKAPLHPMEVHGELFRKGPQKMIAEKRKDREKMEGEYVNSLGKRIGEIREFSLESMKTTSQERTKERFGRKNTNKKVAGPFSKGPQKMLAGKGKDREEKDEANVRDPRKRTG
ncbi:uncharacterized protein [Palaemon carinicauda]|uniref:uncharacterized protein n=1 Tax=Palaemon carinicauda TaxID=392227 RepID=UPI0035B60E9F